jgi:hypothetical protein
MSDTAVLESTDLGIGSGATIGHVLHALAGTARALTTSDRVAVAALSVDGKSQTRLVLRGPGARTITRLGMPLTAGLSGWVVENGKAAVSNDLPSDPRVDPKWMDALSVKSGAVVPLVVKGKVVGVFSVYNRRRPGMYEPRDLLVISNLAIHAAAAIMNACLLGQCRHNPLAHTMVWQMVRDSGLGLGGIAAAEERASIARCLHDGVAQDLGNLNFRIQFVEQMVGDSERYDRDWVTRELTIIRQAVADAYDEIRATISQLDGGVKWRGDFAQELRKSMRRFGARSGLHLDLDLGTSYTYLPPVIGIRLLQIAEEALTNVQKHARASRVRVALGVEGRALELSIADDGQGFDPKNAPARGSFGLKMMRERAREIGARLAISSHDGQGTRVAITLSLPWGA